MKTNILGAYISNIKSYEDVYRRLLNACSENKSHYITVNNVHTVIEGVLDNNYKKIINNAFLALPDGKPLSIVAKLKGFKNASRTFGPTLLEKTIEWGQRDNLKHFFFGSSQETLTKIKETVSLKYPDAKVAGMISPPYRQFTDKEADDFIHIINESEADIIWVGLGAPKQEIWMAENFRKMNKGIMIGIGAGFDYIAGNTSHAPEWMKNFSLEWLYRLIQEPGRLWKRYLVTNSLFMLLITAEFLRVKKFN
jgi:N-acetylglucosaminyldiphosphoundecaprenol N-acetyl-beta-D-mannosaminyltransferase